MDIQHIGNALAVKWPDGSEDFISLEKLRHACPCAGCRGEVDVLGQLHKGPAAKLSPAAFVLVRFAVVGAYAIQPFWGDGHSSGIFSFDILRTVAAEKAE